MANKQFLSIVWCIIVDSKDVYSFQRCTVWLWDDQLLFSDQRFRIFQTSANGIDDLQIHNYTQLQYVVDVDLSLLVNWSLARVACASLCVMLCVCVSGTHSTENKQQPSGENNKRTCIACMSNLMLAVLQCDRERERDSLIHRECVHLIECSLLSLFVLLLQRLPAGCCVFALHFFFFLLLPCFPIATQRVFLFLVMLLFVVWHQYVHIFIDSLCARSTPRTVHTSMAGT